MNYYAKIYYDDYDSNNIKTHLHIIEGVYEVNSYQKARVIGDINITENRFIKYRKHPFNVINIGENTITLKKSHYNDTTHTLTEEDTYILLQTLLTTEGHTQENIQKITMAINTISNNMSIKTNNNCLGEWISF
jgi:hypothetical protein